MSSLIDIQKQIAQLQEQASEIRIREFKEKVALVKETMSAYGITIEDLQGKPAKAMKTKSTSPASAKFTGPNGESWSGRGLMPRWLSGLVAAGHTKDEYLIKKSTSAA